MTNPIEPSNDDDMDCVHDDVPLPMLNRVNGVAWTFLLLYNVLNLVVVVICLERDPYG